MQIQQKENQKSHKNAAESKKNVFTFFLIIVPPLCKGVQTDFEWANILFFLPVPIPVLPAVLHLLQQLGVE